MKFLFIAPEGTCIPPQGHGAVESIVYDYYSGLSRLGHVVKIYQGSNFDEFKLFTDEFKPDICYSHCYYGVYRQFLHYCKAKLKFATNHFGEYYNDINTNKKQSLSGISGHFNVDSMPIPDNINFICLSQEILRYHHDILGVDFKNLFFIPNRVYPDNFTFNELPTFNKSIYLGAISERKRQFLVKGIDMIEVVHDKSKTWLHNNLTNYKNSVLLSSSEAASLSIVESLMSGLGIVISNACSYNLDTNLEFINVISEDNLNMSNIQNLVMENAEVCHKLRKHIRDYAMDKFDFNKSIKELVDIIHNI